MDCIRARMDIEAAVGRDFEAAAFGVSLETGFARDLDLAGAAADFHQFRCADVEGELAVGQYHAHRLARTVGEEYRVRYALAVEEYIGFGTDADVIDSV